MNGNYDRAYIGIGRSLLRQEEYEEALDYFRLNGTMKTIQRHLSSIVRNG